MNILITTGVSKNEVGGPGQYGHNLLKEFETLNHNVKILGYSFEKKLPIGIRHLFFFFKALPKVFWADYIITLDTFSVGVPTVAASQLLSKPSTVRVGGDFLWEAYVNRTKAPVTLKMFYESQPLLNTKEKIIYRCTNWLLKNVTWISFNTEWQKSIWEKKYSFNSKKSIIIKNYIPKARFNDRYESFDFVSAGRDIPLKNLNILYEVFDSIKVMHPEVNLKILTHSSHNEVLASLENCYAAILPSLTDISPNFIIEAASFGKPFIMTRETGLKEILPEGGVYIDPTNIEEIKTAVLDILDKNMYTKTSEALKNTYMDRDFSILAKEFLAPLY
jgi:glycosyltransferase involved in cell wall biosynthesis